MHYGSHERSLFEEAVCVYFDTPANSDIPTVIDEDGEKFPINVVMGRLWNCTDIMPSELCEAIDISRGSTYAQGARCLKPLIDKKRFYK